MLVRGSRIQGKLIEAIEENRWIISFQGQLLQVQNSTPIKFKEGKRLNLRVEQANPLILRVLSESFKNHSIDKFV